MKDYCLGYRFNDEGSHVVLILKNRPQWQAGRYNGVGGRIEENESPAESMRREFLEETGVNVLDWELFAVMETGHGTRLFIFRSFGDISQVETMTDEKVAISPISAIGQGCIPNLSWIIPMALSMDGDSVKSFTIREVSE